MKTSILNELTAMAAAGEDQRWLNRVNEPAPAGVNQFVVFLKPEVMAVQDGVDLEGILEIVLESLSRYQVQIRNTRLLSGTYLQRHNVMGRHYGVINQISREGRTALTDSAEARLKELFKEALEGGAEVLGGHQFIEDRREFSALAACTISDNLGVQKLGGGSYATPVKVLGKPYILLNAFHPQQLVPFYDPANTLLVFECISTTPWKDLRVKLTGATNPAKAEKGSIRNLFLENRERLGLADVSQGANGIHLSAGPLEGMVELVRFLADEDSGHSIPLRETSFGALLEAQGVPEGVVVDLALNPDLQIGEKLVSAFDYTEECDAGEAAGRLKDASIA